MNLNEFKFLISHLVPSSWPFLRTDKFTSALKEPSCIFPSHTSMYISNCLKEDM